MSLVSVFIPVYNREHYISEAITSVLEQSFQDFELLIINDGSSDRTEEVILSFDSPQIRYYKNEHNLGIAATRNKGLELAQGKYLALLDSDDIALPNRLQVQVEYMESHPEVVISGTFFKQFGCGNRCRYELFETNDEIKSFLLWETPFLQPTISMRLNKIRIANLWYSEENNIAEDYDFFERVAMEIDDKFANLKCKLTKYRRHPYNITFSKRSAVIARKSRKKRRTRRLKALLGEAYSDRYPEIVDIIYFQKVFSIPVYKEAFELLKMLAQANNQQKIYSSYHFNKYLELQKFLLVKRFIFQLIKDIFIFNCNTNYSLLEIKLILGLITEKETLIAKVIFLYKFVLISIKIF